MLRAQDASQHRFVQLCSVDIGQLVQRAHDECASCARASHHERHALLLALAEPHHLSLPEIRSTVTMTMINSHSQLLATQC